MADLWEISNPSDAYTIEGEREVVCAAVLFLGEGAYGLHDADGKSALPIFAFSRDAEAALDAFWRETFGHPFAEGMKLRAGVAAALDTVMIGKPAERARMERVLAAITSPEDRERARAAWHDERRSSLNDIGARAKQIAANLRRKEAARG